MTVRARGIGHIKTPTRTGGFGNQGHADHEPTQAHPAFNQGHGYRPCADENRYDPDWWFAAPTDPTHRMAKDLCGTCDARERCAAWALKAREPHGIYGGLDERQRAAMLRAHHHPRRANCHTETKSLRSQ